MGKILVVTSGKGGVGKTTTCVNLASALSHLGKNVILVDGNLTTPNIGLHLGLTKFPITMMDVLKGEAGLTDAIYIHPLGFKILPGSLSIRSFAEINSQKLNKIFKDLKSLADYIVVDSAAGLGNEALTVIKNADEIVIVTNPELPAVTDAFKIVTLAKEIGIPVKGVVLNRVRKDNYDLGVKAVESLLEAPISSVIYDDKNMRESIYNKKPMFHLYPKSNTSKQYHYLARRVHEDNYDRRLEELDRELGLFKRLMRSFGF